VARVTGKYPSRREAGSATLAVYAAHAAARADVGAGEALAADAAEAAARAADAADAVQAAARAAEAVEAAAHAARTAVSDPKHIASGAAWREVRSDVERLEKLGISASVDLPLWSRGPPKWAADAWASFQASLPKGEDWEVWFDWYEQRLGGGSRGEDYELVFAGVPQEEWGKGPAAANAWIKAHLPHSEGYNLKEPVEPDSLKQQAALYAFRLADGRIAVAPEEANPEDREATRDFLDESRRKAAELRQRLMRAQADGRLQRTLALLDERLAPPIEAIRVGLVLSSLRSLESDVRAYDTEEGRKEHPPDLIAALADLSGTVRDFASQFPRSREILANQIALELVEEPSALNAAIEASENLVIAAASHPQLVDRDAPEALKEPKESAEVARTTADRAKQVGLRLLTAPNFGRIVAQRARSQSTPGTKCGNASPKPWARSRKVRGSEARALSSVIGPGMTACR
jgi:hypothetical protein